MLFNFFFPGNFFLFSEGKLGDSFFSVRLARMFLTFKDSIKGFLPLNSVVWQK